uniref:Uncharacterized protein n=1 Tax=Ceratitis capitata TaxID=7213 RepID=W8BL85_CERCA
MNKTTTKNNNKSKNNYCKQVSASEASIKCPQLLTQSMASNSTGRGTETSALGSTDSTSETVPTTTISHQLPNSTTAASAQRVRTKSASAARKSPQASTAHKSKMTATIAGSASEHTVGCVPTDAFPSAPTPSTTLSAVCADPNEYCKVIDTVKHKSAQGDELPAWSCVVEYARIIDVGFPPHSALSTSDKRATATAPAGDVKRRTTKKTADPKIATTTSKHTASSALALTVTRQTHTRTPAIVSVASATCALRQLTKEKTNITSTTITTTTTVATTTNTSTAASATVMAGEAAHSFATTTRRPVHSASARLTSTSSARISSTASQVEGVALTATVDTKSKFTENKCPLGVLTNVSNQRKVEANSTIPATEQQCKLVNSNTNSNNSISSESNNKQSKRNSTSVSTNRVPSNEWPPTEVSSVSTEYDPAYKTSAHADTTTTNSRSKDTVSTVNLAARKAKLKSDFFKIFQVHELVSPHSKQTTSLTDICGAVKTQRISCKDFCKAQSAKIDKSSPRANQQSAYTAAEGLPRIDVQPVEVDSLVAQRRLALTQKFEQHSTPKSSYRSHKHQLIGAVKVEDLVQRFERQTTKVKRKRMIVQPQKTCEHTDIDMLNLKPDTLELRNSPISDEGCNLGQSPYSSDSEDTTEIAKGRARNAVEHIKRKGKVVRTASSDSAVDLDVDECMDTAPAQPPVGAAAGNQQRRMTLTVTDLPLRPALLPLAEPTALPDTTLIELPPKALCNPPPEPVAVPSKVLLEERVVELPEDPRTLAPSLPCSRRESAQSCASDTMPTEFPVGKRFVRTPSVVVSDYSDEILCGITLEEIEYLRAQRMRRRHSSLDTANEGEGECDVSASSSCSNLYYCGSTISALDGAECYVNGIRTALERKASDCSTCSVSADEETFTIHEDPQAESKDISELLAAQHLDAKPTTGKKVGLVVPIGESLSEKINY